MSKPNLVDLSPVALAEQLEQWGEPTYRAKQIIQWIHGKRITEFAQMSNLSKSLRDLFEQHYMIEWPEIALMQTAKDGTIKWLFRLQDGNCIETVCIPDGKRRTLCVSSQVGCALNCSFCATGKEGFNRNLTLSEIIGQLWLAVGELLPSGARISNVVFMGMGEPLLNFDPVMAAIDLMLTDVAYGLSQYRVTLSTSGLIPAIERFKAASPASLAVSLHAPNDACRSQLVPLNKKYNLEQLMAVCRDYFPAGSRRKIVFEYVMLEGINDSPQFAKQLVRLLQGVPAKLNLIPFNTFPGTQYKTSSWPVIEAFQAIMMKSGIDTRVRRTRGEDVAAACGQLAGEVTDRTGRHQRWLKTGQLIPVVVESRMDSDAVSG